MQEVLERVDVGGLDLVVVQIQLDNRLRHDRIQQNGHRIRHCVLPKLEHIAKVDKGNVCALFIDNLGDFGAGWSVVGVAATLDSVEANDVVKMLAHEFFELLLGLKVPFLPADLEDALVGLELRVRFSGALFILSVFLFLFRGLVGRLCFLRLFAFLFFLGLRLLLFV